MHAYVTILLVFYFIFLASLAIGNKFKKIDSSHYLFMKGNVGFFLGSMGLMASFFSAFSLKGMPEFFYHHGLGTWLVLCMPVIIQVSLILPLGLWIRKRVKTIGQKNKTQIYNARHLFETLNLPQVIQIFFLIFISLFLLPYITIQIKGVSSVLSTVFSIDLFGFSNSFLFWSISMGAAIFLYSSTGGIKSIYITDSVQGIISLIAIWGMAGVALKESGGLEHLFAVNASNEKLFSLPGPKNLLTIQFILSYVISLSLMQVSQPHLFIRLLINKNQKTFVKICLTLAIVSPLVFLPSVIIGFYGISLDKSDFLVDMLINTVPPLIAAIYVLGLLSASMSTADSQIFAIGTEWSDFFKKKYPRQQVVLTKAFAFLMTASACFIAQYPLTSLVVFARNSFTGTALISPIILASLLFYQNKKAIFYTSGMVLFFASYFLLSLFKIVPTHWGGIDSTLIFYSCYVVFFITTYQIAKK